MNAGNQYNLLNSTELNNILTDIDEEIDDLEIERRLTLGGTGSHIGAGEVEALRSRLDKEKEKLLLKRQSILEVIDSKS